MSHWQLMKCDGTCQNIGNRLGSQGITFDQAHVRNNPSCAKHDPSYLHATAISLHCCIYNLVYMLEVICHDLLALVVGDVYEQSSIWIDKEKIKCLYSELGSPLE